MVHHVHLQKWEQTWVRIFDLSWSRFRQKTVFLVALDLFHLVDYSTCSNLLLYDLRSHEILTLHLIELVDATDIVVVVIVNVLLGIDAELIRLKIQVLQWHRVGCVIEIIEIAAVERYVGTANALARVRRIVCNGEMPAFKKIVISHFMSRMHLPSGENGMFGFKGLPKLPSIM
jgi:hypothetical protein